MNSEAECFPQLAVQAEPRPGPVVLHSRNGAEFESARDRKEAESDVQ